jgi:protein-tyrosine-phosphatase
MKQVLFVCTHDAGRSQMAGAYAQTVRRADIAVLG